MAYTTEIKENNLTMEEIGPVLVLKFEETLTKGDLIWYSYLTKISIRSFAKLVNVFINAHSKCKGREIGERHLKNLAGKNRGSPKLHRSIPKGEDATSQGSR